MIPLDLAATLILTQRLLGVGLLIQSVELWYTRDNYGPGGFFGGRSVVVLLLVRAALAASLVLAPLDPISIAMAAVLGGLLASTVALTMKSRGPLCGGSDSMFFQVQLGLFVAALGFWLPVLAPVGLGWIAAQSVLSYFLAGWAKLKNRGWRDGAALRHLFASNGPYVLFQPLRALASQRDACAALGWGVVLFELLFPVVLVLPFEARLGWLAFGLIFHVSNAVGLGLNRFIWAWGATYPALLYFQ